MDKKKLQTLKQVSRLSNMQEIETFENITYSIKTNDNKNNHLLAELFCIFNDNGCDEVMFSLVHAVESFSDSDYTQTFLKNLGKIFKNSVYWTCILLIRIVNNDDSLVYLKQYIHLADKRVFNNVLDTLEKDDSYDEKHKKIFIELRKLI